MTRGTPWSVTGVNQAVSQLATAPHITARCAIVIPHPDDESIGVGGSLWRMRDPVIICLTDGAPFDSRFWPAAYPDRETYAAVRKRELYAALGAARVAGARVRHLDCVDQTCVLHIETLVHALVQCLVDERPDIVIVTPYEGGHPDHDCAALVARAAVALLHRQQEPAPILVEMTSYHGRAGRLEYGQFLSDSPSVGRVLTPEDLLRKRNMLEAHASQVATLNVPPATVERFRPAPDYDFTKPPHSPPLHYENLGWPITALKWCELAAAALGQLNIKASVSS